MKKAKTILAIDPGPVQSAFVVFDGERVLEKGIVGNDVMLDTVIDFSPSSGVRIEMIASYGMPVGREVFETCVWIGRFLQGAGLDANRDETSLVYRQPAKLHLCGSPKAKDGNVRQALLDRFGGSREAAIGVKRDPGPLYGVSSHMWAALAVAVFAYDTENEK